MLDMDRLCDVWAERAAEMRREAKREHLVRKARAERGGYDRHSWQARSRSRREDGEPRAAAPAAPPVSHKSPR